LQQLASFTSFFASLMHFGSSMQQQHLPGHLQRIILQSLLSTLFRKQQVLGQLTISFVIGPSFAGAALASRQNIPAKAKAQTKTTLLITQAPFSRKKQH
jgi:hypothetical protein